MSHAKIAVLITIAAASLGLLISAFTPKAGAGGLADSAASTSGRKDQNQARAQALVGRHHGTPWTPRRLPLQRLLAPSGPAAALSTTTWTSIGPSPVDLSPISPYGNASGRITAIAAHPTLANTIYVATAGGGVWKTTNGGTTWTPLTDAQRTLSMGAIAIAKSNPSVIYAGTGEINGAGGDNNFGRGILISTDAGATWTLSTGPSNTFDRLTTAQIAVDPTNASVAYAAIADFGNNGLCCANTGIWKTTDGGTTWTNTTTTIDSVAPWTAIVVDPTTSTTLYAAVGDEFGFSTNGIYKSTNSGATWTSVGNLGSFGRTSLALARSNSQVLYVTVANTDGNGSTLAGVLRSDNGGTSYTNVNPPFNYMGSQGNYDQTVIVDPSNSAIVYVAGSLDPNVHTGGFAGGFLRSTDSGATWTDISHAAAPLGPHVDHHGIDFDANGKLLDGDDGGIYRLDDPTTPTWADLNGNLTTTQFTGIGLHPTNASIVIGGSQDNGTELYVGNSVWTATDGGDGGFAKFSPTNGNRAYHQIPAAFSGGRFFNRSDNGGNTWTNKSLGISDTTQNFYAPFAVDSNNGDRVLYGTTRVWETTDGGDNWTPISAVGSGGFNSGGNTLDAIGIAPSDVNTIYVATGGFSSIYSSGDSQIFVTTNRGTSWTEHDLPAGSLNVNDIQVDPTSALIAYAVVNRFSANGHVFRTTDGGVTWTNISGTGAGALPDLPVWSIQIDSSTTPSTLYVGADDGVYSSTDRGVTWSRFGAGLPHVQVFQVALNGSLHILGAATHGRSAWEIQTAPTPTPTLTSVVSRMTHGSITMPPFFGITLPLPVGTRPRGVECRSSASLGAGNYTMVFTFTNNLTSVASATVTGHDPTTGTGMVSSTAIGPNASLNLTANQYQVNLTNVSNGQYITVTLNSVLDVTGASGNVVSPQMGVLIGDVNGDGFVLSGDYTTVRKNSGNNVDGTTFRYDTNADGFILSGDYTTVRKLSGTQLPSTP